MRISIEHTERGGLLTPLKHDVKTTVYLTEEEEIVVRTYKIGLHAVVEFPPTITEDEEGDRVEIDNNVYFGLFLNRTFGMTFSDPLAANEFAEVMAAGLANIKARIIANSHPPRSRTFEL